ncbi:MAG: Glyoxalase family protein [uncultured Rubrobacteraceae bacterium]|uniref:Glyoxalase family protein n=1 Tax=uncultured Rubrobacteraceae bacterium TaxID=349277 RepID=A0A6J4R8S2_9ACTN|nr:MAG: Glyoxalase family protein [uncultured Rubrobacteraceae bacterium]
MQLGGLHHVTAVTTRAAENVAFYTGVLGMRLVKKTVNQDDVSAYHLFYGDELGRPGTEVTFFDWPHLRVAPNHAGAGEISATELRVRGSEALDWWAGHLTEHGVQHTGVKERDGRLFIGFTDAEGQRLRLADDGGEGVAGGIPWADSSVPAEFGIRGLGMVDLTVRELGPTAWVLAEALGFRLVGEHEEGEDRVAVFEVGAGGPGSLVRVIEQPDAPPAHLGRGGVHHVAFRTANDEEQRLWRERLRAMGLGVTPQIDRYYFRSIYFREPGGILFEIATDGPGFATDEDATHLGERLSLPPFLEGRREEIEGRLEPIPVAGGASRR